MQAPFKQPSGTAIAMLIGGVTGGLGLVYAPTQIDDHTTWQWEWAEAFSVFGAGLVVLVLVWFALAHIRWPHRIARVLDLRASVFFLPERHQWLVDIDETQRDSLSARLVVVGQHIRLDHLDGTPPSILLEIAVFNGSTYGIMFDADRVSGRVRSGFGPSSPLTEPPQFEGSVGAFPSGRDALLRLRQPLDSETARKIQNESDREGFERIDWLDISGIKLWVTADYDDARPVPYMLAKYGNDHVLWVRN